MMAEWENGMVDLAASADVQRMPVRAGPCDPPWPSEGVFREMAITMRVLNISVVFHHSQPISAHKMSQASERGLAVKGKEILSFLCLFFAYSYSAWAHLNFI